MSFDKEQSPERDLISLSLIDILCERGQYEEKIIEQIKEAYDQNNQSKVFALVGKLLYDGPGAVGRTDTGVVH